MSGSPYIAETASLVGDPARANMLIALMGGQALTAKELALSAHVMPQTASGHLVKLTEGGLIRVTPQGRHRYYRLASAAVADMLEGMMLVAGDGPPRHRPKSCRDDALAEARMCYDHLAGRLGVSLADALGAQGHIIFSEDAAIVTVDGRRFIEDLGLVLNSPRRAFCRACLDWSERRWHLGGATGAALADHFIRQKWIRRVLGSRALKVTVCGQAALQEIFSISWDESNSA